MPSLSSDPWNSGERMEFEVSLQKRNFLLILENSHADWRKGGKAALCLYQFETTCNLSLSALLQRDENVQCLGCLKISAGGRRNNWMMSFHRQMSYSLPEQPHLSTALWQPAHSAFECQSAWLGDKHRTCCSQWLWACIFTRGLVGLGFLSRPSLEWVKGETVPAENLTLKFTFLLHTSPAYLCAGPLVLGVREPCITKPLFAKLLPGWHLSFINWFCYSVLWVESYIPAFKTKRCWSPDPQSLSVEGTYPHYLRIWPYWEIGLGQMWSVQLRFYWSGVDPSSSMILSLWKGGFGHRYT